MLPVVSIVGRPNVGKSTIFNRLIGKRKAIVDDFYGVTRDRHYGECTWNGRDFSVIDTGGYLTGDAGVIETGTREQISIAIEESDLILFTVDVKTGMTSLDEALADLLLQQKTPVLLVANKSDNDELELNAAEFYSLGFEELFTVSAINGRGTGDLLDRVVELLPQLADTEDDQPPKLAIVGRPNVGKSSYVNALLNDNRCIVTDIPGTTRDSINSRLIYGDREYTLIDTAGLRKQKNVKENVEFYSTVRTDRALRECDVAILLVDAMQGFEHQDIHILREAADYNKGIIIALNKWDIVPDKDTAVFKEFEEYVYSRIPDMRWIPIVAISALTKQRIYRVLNIADEVIEERAKEISTSSFNNFLQDTLKKRPLPMKRGKALKIKYGLQVKSKPPVFKFFMNMPSELPANYRRFLEREIRSHYTFTGVPITTIFREK
jgi:GTP-binding protein